MQNGQTPDQEKIEFLTFLTQLTAYIEGGIYDYLKDNDIDDYLEVGDGMDDFLNLDALNRIRRFVEADDYPWWATDAPTT